MYHQYVYSLFDSSFPEFFQKCLLIRIKHVRTEMAVSILPLTIKGRERLNTKKTSNFYMIVRICTRQLFTDKQLLFIIKSSIEVHVCFTDISTITDCSSIVSRFKVVHAWCSVIASHIFAKQVIWCMSLDVRLLEAVQWSHHHMTNTHINRTSFHPFP